MAVMIKQLREESTDRMREILAETQEALFKHKMRIATGEGVNPHEARNMRLDIARMKTLLRAVEYVVEHAGVDDAAARAALEANSWGPKKAAAAAKVDAPAGS
jgi:ribosomal protein L29